MTYDRTKPEGSRVVAAEVRCAACQIPEYQPLDNQARYFLLSSDFLIKGGDGYTMLKDEQLSRTSYGECLTCKHITILTFNDLITWNYLIEFAFQI